MEALFHAYFVRGLNTGSRPVLYDIAGELGYDVQNLRAYLYSDRDVGTFARKMLTLTASALVAFRLHH